MTWLVSAAAVVAAAAALLFWLRRLAVEAEALSASVRRLVNVAVAVDDLQHRAGRVRDEVDELRVVARHTMRPDRALPTPPLG
jgi:hypothetical protein